MLLYDSARDGDATGQTRHTVVATVQINHRDTACFLMQTVDVLVDIGC